MEMMLTPAQDKDIPNIVVFLNRAYRGTGTAVNSNTEADFISGDFTSEHLLRKDLLKNADASLLLLRDGEGPFLGCVWLQPRNDDQWYLGTLAIEPERQNFGYGKRLLSLAEQWVREKGGKSIRMTVVNVRTPLLSWYLRRGYSMTGESEPFPNVGDNRSHTLLRDDLALITLQKSVGEEGSLQVL